jgi:hypothetical protein
MEHSGCGEGIRKMMLPRSQEAWGALLQALQLSQRPTCILCHVCCGSQLETLKAHANPPLHQNFQTEISTELIGVYNHVKYLEAAIVLVRAPMQIP